MWSFAVARQGPIAGRAQGPTPRLGVRPLLGEHVFGGVASPRHRKIGHAVWKKLLVDGNQKSGFHSPVEGQVVYLLRFYYIPGGAGFLPKNFERQTHIMIPILFQLLRWDWTESPRIFGRSWKIQVLYIDWIRAPTEIKKNNPWNTEIPNFFCRKP